MKEYTVIWESGDSYDAFRFARKTFIKCESIEKLMKSKYGYAAKFIFDGFVLARGETLDEEAIVTIILIT